MSETTIKAVWLGKKAEDLCKLRKSRGSAPVIWNEMAKRYLGAGDFEYSRRIDGVWPLYERSDIPKHHRAVLLMTCDNAIVMKKDFLRAASDIRAFLADFPPRAEYANHWPKIAEIFESTPDCDAIGFWMTSVCEDPFCGEFNEDKEEYEQPDWSIYWDAYSLIEK